MNAWLYLTKKEFRLGLPAFLVALILYSGIIAAGIIAGNRFGFEDEIMSIVFMIVIALHTFFLAFYLYHSLNTERKRLHLWLHTPMSIAGLLASKIFTGIVFMLSTLIVSVILAMLSLRVAFSFFSQESLINTLGSISITIFLMALFISSVFLLFWSIFLTFSQKWNDFFSFLLTILLFFVSVWAYGNFIHLPFVQMLTNWGAIQAGDMITGIEVSYVEESVDILTIKDATVFYIGNFLRDFIFSVLLFSAACWIIERKVEV
ncbi:hypothetical protein [Oceanobacillus saliphilus]|uniref:hypothetical protein n=1 Tax=Oceanobacillus saliphilus TaxID=2925834 RepID=UPI00201E57DF|nr:hypothetical protein [Oceanobacillus saliphilus]